MLSITECSWKQSPLWRVLGKWMHCWLPVTTHNTKAQLFTLGSAYGDIIISPGKKRWVIKMNTKRAGLENAAWAHQNCILNVFQRTAYSSLALVISVNKKTKCSFYWKIYHFLFLFGLSFLSIFSTIVGFSCVLDNWLRMSWTQFLRSLKPQVKN